MNTDIIKWSLPQLGWNSEFDMHFEPYATQGYNVEKAKWKKIHQMQKAFKHR